MHTHQPLEEGLALEGERLEWTSLPGRLGPGRNTSSSRRRKYWGDSLKKGKVIGLALWSNWDPWSATPPWIWPRAGLDLRGNWCLERPSRLSHRWGLRVSGLSKDVCRFCEWTVPYAPGYSGVHQQPHWTGHIKADDSPPQEPDPIKASFSSCALIVCFFRLQFCNYCCFLSSRQFLPI